MKPETKVYSDFLKRHNINANNRYGSCIINEKLIRFSIQNHPNGKWSINDEDSCYTKKAAMYYFLKKQLENETVN